MLRGPVFGLRNRAGQALPVVTLGFDAMDFFSGFPGSSSGASVAVDQHMIGISSNPFHRPLFVRAFINGRKGASLGRRECAWCCISVFGFGGWLALGSRCEMVSWPRSKVADC